MPLIHLQRLEAKALIKLSVGILRYLQEEA